MPQDQKVRSVPFDFGLPSTHLRLGRSLCLLMPANTQPPEDLRCVGAVVEPDLPPASPTRSQQDLLTTAIDDDTRRDFQTLMRSVVKVGAFTIEFAKEYTPESIKRTCPRLYRTGLDCLAVSVE